MICSNIGLIAEVPLSGDVKVLYRRTSSLLELLLRRRCK
jgi:hypothetical protein